MARYSPTGRGREGPEPSSRMDLTAHLGPSCEVLRSVCRLVWREPSFLGHRGTPHPCSRFGSTRSPAGSGFFRWGWVLLPPRGRVGAFLLLGDGVRCHLCRAGSKDAAFGGENSGLSFWVPCSTTQLVGQVPLRASGEMLASDCWD